MTIVALIATAAFFGVAAGVTKYGPGRPPEQNDLDFD
jgi:hypothetical protein